MAFTVADFADLVQLLAQRPEWQVELRHLILSEDFLALPKIVRELAGAQQRTEGELRALTAEVRALAEAQRRTEQRVDELAEAQRRTDERLQELATQVQGLATQVQGLATAYGQLQAAFGATIEEEAESVIRWMLEGQGYRLLAEPHFLVLDGELDVVMPLHAPTGEKVWAVVEAKARLGYRQVREWAQRMHSREWHQRLAAEGVSGPYLVYAYGIRTDPGAEKAARDHGIGLATGRGERVSPKGLIGPLAS